MPQRVRPSVDTFGPAPRRRELRSRGALMPFGPTQEGLHSHIDIPDVPKEVVEYLLLFIYTSGLKPRFAPDLLRGHPTPTLSRRSPTPIHVAFPARGGPPLHDFAVERKTRRCTCTCDECNKPTSRSSASMQRPPPIARSCDYSSLARRDTYWRSPGLIAVEPGAMPPTKNLAADHFTWPPAKASMMA